MPPLRPPDPPSKMGTINVEMDIESSKDLASVAPPPKADGTNGLILFLTQLIDDPSNCTTDGNVLLNRTMIDLLRILIRAEKERIEADKRQDDQIAEIKKMVASQQLTIPAIPSIPRPLLPSLPTYASRTATPNHQSGRRPTCLLPAREELRSLRPGRAVIHSNPLNNQIDKIPRALFVQRENETLAKMNAKVQGEMVTVTGAHIMNSGDIVFYTKNKTHQQWLMENKHIWSRQVHPDLEATPSTWSVLVHGIPKEFNPTSDLSKSSLAMADRKSVV